MSEVHEFLLRIMTFWTVQYLDGLVIQLVFYHIILILFPDSSVNWASKFPFHHNFKDTVPPSEVLLWPH